MNSKRVTNTGVVYDLSDKEVKEEKTGKKKVSKSGEIYEESVKKPVSKPEEEEEASNNATNEPSDEYKRGFQAALEMIKQQQAQQA